MNTIKFTVLALFSLTLFSCDHNVTVETVMNDDESIDRTIILEGDSSEVTNNYFGINENSGWDVTLAKLDSSKNNKKLKATYKKHFNTIDESNLELNNGNDTLFHIKATLEKRFRWFYTYLRYSDTYHKIERFPLLNQADYFTPEDYTFMKRLPPEGDSISKADELFLQDLTAKINDVLVPRAVFEEHYALFPKMVSEFNMDARWADTLAQHKESIYSLLLKREDMTDDALLFVFDSLQIPFPQEVSEKYRVARKPIEARLEFMSYANTGKYFYSLKLPGEIIDTNADSLAGEYAAWKPSMYKFIAEDYTMYAETRKLNLWAVIVSVLVLLTTIYVFVKKS